MLLLENNQLQGGNSNSALCWAAAYYPVDYFPLTAFTQSDLLLNIMYRIHCPAQFGNFHTTHLLHLVKW